MSNRILASMAGIALLMAIAHATAGETSTAVTESSVSSSQDQAKTIERLKTQLSVAEDRLEAANKIRRENSKKIGDLLRTVNELARRLTVSEKLISSLDKEQLAKLQNESQKQISELEAKEEESLQVKLAYDILREQMREGNLVLLKLQKTESASGKADVENE